MNENDEKALIALLATKLHPDAQGDLSRAEIKTFLEKSEGILDEERAVFEAIDPLALIREQESGPAPIPFPAKNDYEDLPKASGFYRGGEQNNAAQDTRESINKKRAEIRKRLQIENDESGSPASND
ncbi:MAG: hypothetical protein PHI93_12145 [Kiritimatiellae bacterium]|jgi:hypothetical protein|nr:hypothetical protein [Kiritimatiellia bacterium]